MQAPAASQATAAAKFAAAARAVAGKESQERAHAKTIICFKRFGKSTEYGTPDSRAIVKGCSCQGYVVERCVISGGRDKTRTRPAVYQCCSKFSAAKRDTLDDSACDRQGGGVRFTRAQCHDDTDARRAWKPCADLHVGRLAKARTCPFCGGIGCHEYEIEPVATSGDGQRVRRTGAPLQA